MNPLVLCNNIFPQFWLFSSNVPPLVYYSHLPIIAISLLLAGFVLWQNKKGLPNIVLFGTLMAFVVWTLCDAIYWASNRSDVIMFVWSMDILFEPLVYIGSLYLIYVIIKKTDLIFVHKLLLTLIYLPTLILVPTHFSLSGFDLGTCLSIEHPIIVYTSYGTEIFLTLLIIGFSVFEFIKATTREAKQKIVYLSIGIILFLIAFAWGNITGSFTDDWKLGQFGLFGLPVFAAFLVYSIVRFKIFNIKLIAAQALVAALWVLVPSVLFIRTIDNVRIIVSVTSLLLLILGIYLVKSVKMEVEQREQIAKMAEDITRAYAIEKRAKEELEKLDKIKNNFLAQTQHDLRTPLGIIRDYCDLLIGGALGKIPKKATEKITRISVVAQNKIKDVNNFLDTAQFQLGKKVVNPVPGVQLNPIMDEIIADLGPGAKTKGIELTLDMPKEIITLAADREKLKAALFNIIDNSIKYTLQGGVTITVNPKSQIPNHKQIQNSNEQNSKTAVEIMVKDTGIGIPKEKIATLFDTAFERSAAAKSASPTGKGIGLYLSSQIIKAHEGKVWVESKGEGLGSTFHIELPM